MAQPTPVRVWIDPSCPWAWQTSLWLRDLRDRGLVELSWSIFSLELNASEPDTPFWEACARHGESLVSLALARREGGDEGFEALYQALGDRVHERKEGATHEQIAEAAAQAGMRDLPDRARVDTDLVDEVTAEFLDARDQDVFGVPTLRIGTDKVVFGPLVAVPPRGDDAIALWEQTRGLSARQDFFELKRWPRDIRPGEEPVGSV
jgi:predicted DsbA family dithiol-disulfide isomerase